MNTFRMSILTGCWIWIGIMFPVTAGAQSSAPARSFQELQSTGTLKRGTTVHIYDDSGKKLKAKIEAISNQDITVTVGRGGLWQRTEQRVLSESAVKEIRRRDHWWNGMLIGAAAGGVPTFFATRLDYRLLEEPSARYTAVVAAAALGGVLGATIDLAVGNKEGVFVRPGVPDSSRLRISPVIAKGQAGLKVELSF